MRLVCKYLSCIILAKKNQATGATLNFQYQFLPPEITSSVLLHQPQLRLRLKEQHHLGVQNVGLMGATWCYHMELGCEKCEEKKTEENAWITVVCDML